MTAIGALSLSYLLPRLVALKQFNISDNNIGMEGYNQILHAVNEMENCPLQVLQLPVSGNDISMLHSLINKDVRVEKIIL